MSPPDLDAVLRLLAEPSSAGEDLARLPSAPRTVPAGTVGTLVERRDVSASVARFRIRLDVPLTIRPGQYVSLGLPSSSGEPTRRPYSVAAGGRDLDVLEFLIRHVPSGSLTPELWRLRSGAALEVGRPKGRFTLDPADIRPHLLVASGTGLAPLVAMSRALLSEGARRTVLLVHGVSRAEDLAYRAELEAWAETQPAFRYEAIVSRPDDPRSAGWSGRTGRIPDALPDLLREQGLAPHAIVAYLCGNPAMVASATERLVAAGAPEDAIRSERYWSPPLAA